MPANAGPDNREKRFIHLPLVFAAALSLLLPQLAAPQTNTSVVEGHVADPLQTVVSGCTVILTSLQTGSAVTTVTNETGIFIFPSVSVGSYTLKVSKDGFKAYELSDFRVTVEQRATLDVHLQLGSIAESVTVEAAGSAPLIEPSSSELGTLIEPINVQQLPLNGRNYLQLGYLSGTAQDGGPASSDFLATQTGHPDRDITIAGVEQDLVGYTVNGISVAGSRLGDLSLNVSISAIDQFKVVQGFTMPSMGPDPGIVNVVTKSGGNSFHGEAFEFLRNNDLDARNFFEALPHPGPFHRNQFGAAVGGPIRHNRLFFFAHYEGFRQMQANPQTGFAPTQSMFSGDFSVLPAAIYDPQSAASGGGQRQPFPGNVIPSSRINPVAQKLLPYLSPRFQLQHGAVQCVRRTGADPELRPGRHARRCQPDHPQHSVCPIHRRGISCGQPDSLPGVGALLPYEYRVRDGAAHQCLESAPGERASLGLHSSFLFYGGIGQAGIEDKIGLTGTADVNGVPGITLGGFSSFGTAQSVIGNIDNNYQVYDSVKYLHGKHELQAGASLHYVRTTQESANWNARGTLVFNPVFTAQLVPGANGQPSPMAGTGSSFADFLLGMPVSGTVTSMPRTHYRWTEVNPYVQDTWRLRPELTVNFGLGWYVATPPNPSGADWKYPHAFDFQTGKVLYAALNQINPEIYPTAWKNFSPRLGLAWQPTFWRGTVIRAGAGLFYSSERALYDLFGITAPGVSIVQSIANSPNGPLPTYMLGKNVFPPMSQVPITQQFANNLTGTILALDQGVRTPYSSQWNLSIQHPLGKNMLAEVSYVGSQSRRLPVRWNVDDCSSPGSLACNPAALRWPQYSYVYFAADAGFASYNALTAKFQREFSGGFNFLANYTWSRALTDTVEGGANTPLNQMGSCLICDKGMAPFNVPQRLTMATVWQLPVGRGKRLLRGVSPVWDRVVGGWAADVITTFSSGNPFTVNAPNNTADPLTNFRANWMCNGRSQLQNQNLRTNGLYWIDPACFTTPATGYFGNSGANIITGPGVNNWDIAVEKNTQFRESLRAQFRAEFFNAWNHTQFMNPSNTVGAPNFGQVTQALNAREIQFGLKLLW